MGQKSQVNLNINVNNLPEMQCYCGNKFFMRIHTLKYLSPMVTGDPKGGTFANHAYRCLNPQCNQIYPFAMDQGSIDEVGRERKKSDEKQGDLVDAEWE